MRSSTAACLLLFHMVITYYPFGSSEYNPNRHLTLKMHWERYLLIVVAGIAFRQSPTRTMHHSRLSLFRQPRKNSPRRTPLRKTNSPRKTPYRSSTKINLSPLSPLACTQSSSFKSWQQTDSSQQSLLEDNYVTMEACRSDEEVNAFQEFDYGNGDQQVNPCRQETENCEKVTVRRLRKVNSKRHACTHCSQFRLHKYFKDVTCMVCISCLNIWSICSLPVEPPPIKKERHPKCNTCTEQRKLTKRSTQRQSMQNLRFIFGNLLPDALHP